MVKEAREKNKKAQASRGGKKKTLGFDKHEKLKMIEKKEKLTSKLVIGKGVDLELHSRNSMKACAQVFLRRESTLHYSEFNYSSNLLAWWLSCDD